MNDNWFVKFEEYLHGEMSNEEKSSFETALASNEEMSTAFRIYRTIETEMRNNEKYSFQEKALRNSLQLLNNSYFRAEPPQTKPILRLYSRKLYRITAAVAASIVIIFIAYLTFFKPNQDAQRLANNYFDAHLKELSQTMNPSHDTLQLGIEAYNNKDCSKALQYFQRVDQLNPQNSEAKRNIGLVYLATKDYDKALLQFDELAKMENLYSNPGLFLKALTLMQRNKIGDKQKARELLQQVVRQRAEGNKEAEEWLKKI